MVVQDGLSAGEEPGKLAQVEAGNSFNPVFNIIFQAVVGQLLNDVQVLCVIEKNNIFLPKLFSVTWSPSKLLSINLLSQLVN
jgi:hypothetical protein